MKYIEMALRPSRKGAPVTIYGLSCLHVGHRCHEREKTLDLLNHILKTPDTYCVQLGDTVDDGIRSSPGASVYEQEFNPRDQTIIAAALFKPLVDAGKVLWWLESNHSARIFNEVGFFTPEECLAKLFFGGSLSRSDARMLERYANGEYDEGRRRKVQQKLLDAFEALKPQGRPPVYWGGFQSLVDLRVGSQKYRIHSIHGAGAGTALSSAINALGKQMQICEADVYLRGRHHRKASVSSARATVLDGKVVYREVYGVATGCYLSYDGSYGELKGYVPTASGMSRIVLGSDRWLVEAVT